MRRRTYAPGIAGLSFVCVFFLLFQAVPNVTVRIIIGLAVSAVVWIVWRKVEKLIDKGVDKVDDAIHNKLADKRNEKHGNEQENLADRYKNN